MKNHYWARNHVCKTRIKILKARLRRVLKWCNRHDRLQILAEASFVEHDTWLWTFSPNFNKFGENFVIFDFFWSQNRVFCPTHSATWHALMNGTFSRGKLGIFGFSMINYACSGMAERFHQVLGGLKGQKHLENDLSATFCTHRKQSWEIEVLEGQMTSKFRNSIHPYIQSKASI